MPDEDGVDGADAAFGFREETVDGVLGLFGIVERTVPDEQLHLGKDVLRPLQLWPVILRAVVAQMGQAVGPPGFQSSTPTLGVVGRGWPGEKCVFRLGNSGKVEHAGRRNKPVGGFPFVGEDETGEDEDEPSRRG